MSLKLLSTAARAVAIVSVLVIANSQNAFGLVIADEDFEAGAVGWTQNTTTNGGGVFTQFLGRFGNTSGIETISKSFALDGAQTQVVVAFDVYEIDSWDDEVLTIFVDGAAIANERYTHTEDDFDDGSAAAAQSLRFGDGNLDFGFDSAADQGFHYEFVINTAAAIISVGFGSILTATISDASFGIDNLLLVSNSTAGTGPGSGGPASVDVSHPSAPLLIFSLICFLLARLVSRKLTSQ